MYTATVSGARSTTMVIFIRTERIRVTAMIIRGLRTSILAQANQSISSPAPSLLAFTYPPQPFSNYSLFSCIGHIYWPRQLSRHLPTRRQSTSTSVYSPGSLFVWFALIEPAGPSVWISTHTLSVTHEPFRSTRYSCDPQWCSACVCAHLLPLLVFPPCVRGTYILPRVCAVLHSALVRTYQLPRVLAHVFYQARSAN